MSASETVTRNHYSVRRRIDPPPRDDTARCLARPPHQVLKSKSRKAPPALCHFRHHLTVTQDEIDRIHQRVSIRVLERCQYVYGCVWI